MGTPRKRTGNGSSEVWWEVGTMDGACRLATTAADRAAALAVRQRVFVEEQSVPPALEYDRLDEVAIHAVITVGDEIVGAGRLVEHETHFRLGRVCILEPYRRRGLGERLVRFLLDVARSRALKPVMAHVQVAVEQFYRRLGFCVIGDGERFEEAGIVHVAMRYLH